MNCPDGLLWNTDLLTCDWPRNVECKPGCPRAGAPSETPATSSPGRLSGSSQRPRSSARTWAPSLWRSTRPRRTQSWSAWPRPPGAGRTTDWTTGSEALSWLE